MQENFFPQNCKCKKISFSSFSFQQMSLLISSSVVLCCAGKKNGMAWKKSHFNTKFCYERLKLHDDDGENFERFVELKLLLLIYIRRAVEEGINIAKKVEGLRTRQTKSSSLTSTREGRKIKRKKILTIHENAFKIQIVQHLQWNYSRYRSPQHPDLFQQWLCKNAIDGESGKEWWVNMNFAFNTFVIRRK
jgi:hypothetical protein